MGGFNDLTSNKINDLFVIGRAYMAGKGVYWSCKCICGNITIVSSKNIRQTESCGCSKSKMLLNRNYKHGFSFRNGKTKEYILWQGIKNRCYIESNKNYCNYGGRGIKMCDSWANSFESFLRDMGVCPSKNYSIDRINVNGNYEPSNCRWATNHEQFTNIRKNKWFEYNGVKMIQSDWAKYFNISSSCIYKFIKEGKDFNYINNFYLNKNKKLPDLNDFYNSLYK